MSTVNFDAAGLAVDGPLEQRKVALFLSLSQSHTGGPDLTQQERTLFGRRCVLRFKMRALGKGSREVC